MTNYNAYVIIAMQLADDRAREAARRNRFVTFDGDLPAPAPGVARRSLARAVAAVSRGSARLALRLDGGPASATPEGDCLPA
ncbi:MAG TPA: hypothetical protein VGC90_10805 [Candidatus Limnocylindrales bacterium]